MVVTFLVGAILGAASIIIYNNKRYVNSHCVSRLPLSRDAYLVFRLSLYIYAAVWQPDMHVGKYAVELPFICRRKQGSENVAGTPLQQYIIC